SQQLQRPGSFLGMVLWPPRAPMLRRRGRPMQPSSRRVRLARRNPANSVPRRRPISWAQVVQTGLANTAPPKPSLSQGQAAPSNNPNSRPRGWSVSRALRGRSHDSPSDLTTHTKLASPEFPADVVIVDTTWVDYVP